MLHQIAKLFTALKLILFEPLLKQLLPALLQDWSAQLQRLVLVELPLFQKDAKILQQRRRLAWLGRHALEALDGLWSSQDTLMQKSEGKALAKPSYTGKTNSLANPSAVGKTRVVGGNIAVTSTPTQTQLLYISACLAHQIILTLHKECRQLIRMRKSQLPMVKAQSVAQASICILTCGALAATLAASEYCIWPKSILNFLTKSSSAPPRLFLTAMRSARSGFCRVLVM